MDRRTDSEVQNYNIQETINMKIKIERLIVLEEKCLQNLGQLWDVHTDRRTDRQGKNYIPTDVSIKNKEFRFCTK